MLLTPIERPSSPLLRLLYRASARRFGKVIGPLKVIYARRPRLLMIAGQIARTMEHGLSLEPSLRLLVQTQTARQNGCTFCEDLTLAEAVRSRVGRERFNALQEYRTSPVFTGRERAALAFAEEATRDRRLSAETAAAVRAAFTENEIVELAWLNAAENYFNLQAAVLGIESDGLAAAALAKADARGA
jgi:alkylhydroperoxidase family enzyme